MKKKREKEKAVAKIKSSSWSHSPGVRRDLQIKIKSKKPPASSFNRHIVIRDDDKEIVQEHDLTKDVYKVDMNKISDR